jgi:hypothetical protein
MPRLVNSVVDASAEVPQRRNQTPGGSTDPRCGRDQRRSWLQALGLRFSELASGARR